VSARLLDILGVLLLVGAGAAFLAGGLAIGQRKDLHAIYWMVVGIALVRATSNLSRADRANG
jgi:hypothetical protein